MKKISIILVFTLLLSLCACAKTEEKPQEEPDAPPSGTTEPVVTETAPADDTEENDAAGFRWSFEGETLTITGNGGTEDYELFTAPWDEAGNSFSVKKLVVGEGIRYLGRYAFAACCNLVDVSLPSTLEVISEFCFADCGALTEITLPEGLLFIDSSAFSGCGLLEVAFPSSLAEIGSNSFANCIDLKKLTINEGLLNIGQDAFFGCEKLDIILPAGCPSESWFKANGFLYGVSGKASGSLSWSGEGWKLEKGVLTISMNDAMPDFTASGMGAAPWKYLASEVKRIEFTGKLRSIGNYSFWNFSECENISLPEGLENIGDYAFGACTKLSELDLPSTLKSIGYGSFSFCSALKSLTLPDGLESVGADAFVMCNGIKDVKKPESLKTIGAGAFNFQGDTTGELTE